MWEQIHIESFYSKDGRYERLFILKGPTYPCCFYVGPGRGTHIGVVPMFNETNFYHRDEESALTALVEMVEELK